MLFRSVVRVGMVVRFRAGLVHRWRSRQSHQHVEVLPEVLCHEPEESQEGPAETVEAGVAVVWIPPSFHASVALWAAAGERGGGGAGQDGRDIEGGHKA